MLQSPWEKDDAFDYQLTHFTAGWVNMAGDSVTVGGLMTATHDLELIPQRVQGSDAIGDVSTLLFLDPTQFQAGELHNMWLSGKTLSISLPWRNTTKY